MTIPLFEDYPGLAATLPRTELCDLPTPVTRLEKIGSAMHAPSLFVKRDDISAAIFGGNKVRALEFLLGDALHAKAKRAIVIGLAGTSMALASAIYAKQYDLSLAVMLIDQQPTSEARRNLLIFKSLGAEIYSIASVRAIMSQLLRLKVTGFLKYGSNPKVLGASSPLGMAGYVNAAFELKQQIAAGILPEPDRLYIAMGLLGTATGLTLGLRAAGLKTEVVAVVSHPMDAAGIVRTKANMIKLFGKANRFLHAHDRRFPLLTLEASAIQIRCDAPGQTENTLLQAALAQIEPVRQTEGLELEPTWTAPVAAALGRDLEAEHLQDKTLLFWHTANSRPPAANTEGIDWHSLPQPFHHYFQDEMALINKPMHM